MFKTGFIAVPISTKPDEIPFDKESPSVLLKEQLKNKMNVNIRKKYFLLLLNIIL